MEHLVKGSVWLGEHVPYIELLGVSVRHQDVRVLRNLPNLIDLLTWHALAMHACTAWAQSLLACMSRQPGVLVAHLKTPKLMYKGKVISCGMSRASARLVLDHKARYGQAAVPRQDAGWSSQA